LAAIDADRGDETKEVEVEACEKLELKNVATLLFYAERRKYDIPQYHVI
jgi:hypothetical protein